MWLPITFPKLYGISLASSQAFEEAGPWTKSIASTTIYRVTQNKTTFEQNQVRKCKGYHSKTKWQNPMNNA